MKVEIACIVDKSVPRWFGNKKRMNTNFLMKKVINACVDGRVPRGRPRFGWKDGVKNVLSKRGMTMENARMRTISHLLVIHLLLQLLRRKSDGRLHTPQTSLKTPGRNEDSRRQVGRSMVKF